MNHHPNTAENDSFNTVENGSINTAGISSFDTAETNSVNTAGNGSFNTAGNEGPPYSNPFGNKFKPKGKKFSALRAEVSSGELMARFARSVDLTELVRFAQSDVAQETGKAIRPRLVRFFHLEGNSPQSSARSAPHFPTINPQKTNQ